ncbi:hypothetical protein [Fructilactobacillus frigidiflavus]|uniref:hypothetical protein n=1 Tax=Fructilactobacillus frigidiflavus TaxID=3242688 RepID=UPI00375729D7
MKDNVLDLIEFFLFIFALFSFILLVLFFCLDYGLFVLTDTYLKIIFIFIIIVIVIVCPLSYIVFINFDSFSFQNKCLLVLFLIFIGLSSKGNLNAVNNYYLLRTVDIELVGNGNNDFKYAKKQKPIISLNTSIKKINQKKNIIGRYFITYPILSSLHKHDGYLTTHLVFFCVNNINENNINVGNLLLNTNAEIGKKYSNGKFSFFPIKNADSWKNIKNINLMSYDFRNYKTHNNLVLLNLLNNFLTGIMNITIFSIIISLLMSFRKQNSNKTDIDIYLNSNTSTTNHYLFWFIKN